MIARPYKCAGCDRDMGTTTTLAEPVCADCYDALLQWYSQRIEPERTSVRNLTTMLNYQGDTKLWHLWYDVSDLPSVNGKPHPVQAAWADVQRRWPRAVT